MIRRRLVVVILAVVTAVTGGAGVLIVVTLQQRLVADADQELVTQSRAVAPHQEPGHHSEPGLPEQSQEPSPFDVRRYAYVTLDRQGTASPRRLRGGPTTRTRCPTWPGSRRRPGR